MVRFSQRTEESVGIEPSGGEGGGEVGRATGAMFDIGMNRIWPGLPSRIAPRHSRPMIELSEKQVAQFHADGFLILDRLIDPEAAARVAARYENLFRGKFETGLYPDEWNWQEGRDQPYQTRPICNGWESDHTVASLVLSAEIGPLCAQLA